MSFGQVNNPEISLFHLFFYKKIGRIYISLGEEGLSLLYEVLHGVEGD